jgi:hypothetical protein
LLPNNDRFEVGMDNQCVHALHGLHRLCLCVRVDTEPSFY